MPASFGNGSATHYANQTLHVLADKNVPVNLGSIQQITTLLYCWFESNFLSLGKSSNGKTN